MPYRKLSKILWKEVDIRIIDDLGPNGFARLSQNVSNVIVRIQNGYIYRYAFVMVSGIVLITAYIYF